MTDRLRPLWAAVNWLATPDRLALGVAAVMTYVVVLTGTVLHFHTATTGQLMTLAPPLRWFLIGSALTMRGLAAVGAALLGLGAVQYVVGGVAPEVTTDD
jgi:hypothetical protein